MELLVKFNDPWTSLISLARFSPEAEKPGVNALFSRSICGVLPCDITPSSTHNVERGPQFPHKARLYASDPV